MWHFQGDPVTAQKPTEDWSATDVQKAMASRDYFQANHVAAEDRDKLAKRAQSWHERIYNRPDAPETKGLNNLETRKAEDAFLNQLKGLFDEAAQGEGQAGQNALDLTGTIPEGAAVSAGSNDLAHPDQWTTEGFPNEPDQAHDVQAVSQELEEPEKQPRRILPPLPTQEQLDELSDQDLEVRAENWQIHSADLADQLLETSLLLRQLNSELAKNEFSMEGAAGSGLKALVSGAGGFARGGIPGAARGTATSLLSDGVKALEKALQNGDMREVSDQLVQITRIQRQEIEETEAMKSAYNNALKQRSSSNVTLE